MAGYTDLFAEDGVLETPYVAPGNTARLQGKPAIAGFLATLHGVIRLADFRLLAACPAQGDVTVLEYEGTVHLERQGTRFHYTLSLTAAPGRPVRAGHVAQAG